MHTAQKARLRLRSFATKKRADGNARFFKTGKGEYGYGDKFIGVTVPDTRKVAAEYVRLSFTEIKKLLLSKIHEERLLALIILVRQFERGDDRMKKEIYAFYCSNLGRINNWDLVDVSAPQIVGIYLVGQGKGISVLKKFITSKILWERRVAVLATLPFIRKGSSKEIFFVAAKLLGDKEDLMHKATGWMLREVGRCISHTELKKFLDAHAAVMPRTALRYALEHFSEKERLYYLKKRALN